MSKCTLKLFPSQPLVTGGFNKTSFSTEATEITGDNAEEFFRYDHTPIWFADGHCLSANFEHSTAIPFNMDNSVSDAPADWVSPEEIQERLKQLGINFWMAASRHHLLPKPVRAKGKDEERIPRPKFHVYLPLSKPLEDKNRYIQFCEWCIKTYGSDPKVKSPSQKIFGYGKNPHHFVDSWNGGRCIDEVLNDHDLTDTPTPPVATKQMTAESHSLPPAGETIIRLCRQYVAQCSPAIEGQNGDKKTFRVARIIFHDYGLSEEEGRPILEQYNQRCLPPWDDKALQHKVDVAIAHTGTKPKGWRRIANPIEGEFYPPFGAVILSPNRTKPSAEAFLREKYKAGKVTTLKFYLGEFYRWTGNCYQPIHKNIIRGEVLKWLTNAVMLKKDEPVPFSANSRSVNDVVDALKSICTLPDETMSGTWLVEGDVPPVLSPIFAQNCVYDWEKDEKHEHDPRWFNLSCVDARIRNNAPVPKRWLQFLDELWDDDQASKALLHEFMGLTLTADTSFQKMLLLVGQIRAGKGTIIRILTEIHRKENVATPSTTLLTESFGLQTLLGKPVAIVADARFTGKDIQVAIERLLNISGEDDVAINRKFKDPISATKLSTRIVISCNALPVLPDSAGALQNRFLVLQLKESFLGREDRKLMAALAKEKDGILHLMIKGLRRLHRQGFTKTSYQTALTDDLEELGSPIRAFVKEQCDVGEGKWVPTKELYNAWRSWREDDMQQSRKDGDSMRFGRDLKLAFPGIRRKRKRGVEGWCYFGISLHHKGTVAEDVAD